MLCLLFMVFAVRDFGVELVWVFGCCLVWRAAGGLVECLVLVCLLRGVALTTAVLGLVWSWFVLVCLLAYGCRVCGLFIASPGYFVFVCLTWFVASGF